MISCVRRHDGREQEKPSDVETFTRKRVEPGNESRVMRN